MHRHLPNDKIFFNCFTSYIFLLKKNIHINTSIIPKPVSQTINNGVFNLAEKIEIIYDSSFVNEVEYLKSNFPINEGSNQNFIRIEKNSLLKEEEYKILIRTNEIIINASTQGERCMLYKLKTIITQ